LPSEMVKSRGRPYLSKHTDWRKSDPVAVFIGFAREKKGIGVLCKAVEMARAKIPLRLLVIGMQPGTDRVGFMENWNHLVNNDALHLTGQLKRPIALSVAMEGNMIVMPSLDDGMANGLLEGMALGLCPIVSDLFKGVVTANHSGWVVPRNDHKKLAEALVEAGSQPDKRKRFSTNAKAYMLNHHSPKSEAMEYVKLFEAVLLSRG